MPSQWKHLIKPGERANTRGTIKAACGSRVFTSDAATLEENYLITCPRCWPIAESYEVRARTESKTDAEYAPNLKEEEPMSKVTMWVSTETVRNQRVDLVVIGQAIGDMDDERLISMLTTIRSECQDNPAVQAAFANLYNVLEETKESWA